MYSQQQHIHPMSSVVDGRTAFIIELALGEEQDDEKMPLAAHVIYKGPSGGVSLFT